MLLMKWRIGKVYLILLRKVMNKRDDILIQNMVASFNGLLIAKKFILIVRALNSDPEYIILLDSIDLIMSIMSNQLRKLEVPISKKVFQKGDK